MSLLKGQNRKKNTTFRGILAADLPQAMFSFSFIEIRVAMHAPDQGKRPIILIIFSAGTFILFTWLIWQLDLKLILFFCHVPFSQSRE
jgi:hypothetical protein